MQYRTEAKLQGWRALAIFEDRRERLIYLGRSTTQVRAGYVQAFLELFDEEERAQVKSISLQCWHGAADEGKWIPKTTLTIPNPKKAASNLLALVNRLDDEDEEEPTLLPFPASSAKQRTAASMA
ncbi:MAG TPA: hypothetical protein VFA18_15625 [Gemmataceae bacterium]|nr:hypothetical protein [Gemmataceae bacterium]